MRKTIENRVQDIFKECKLNERIPVPVEKIALKMNLAITPTDLGPGVSGALIVNAGKGTIGFNENDSKTRIRYTIAHQLGHFVLHKTENSLFVEKNPLLKSGEESSGEIKKEKEANAFASALLMPDSLVRKEIEAAKARIPSANDEQLVSYLAKKFDVSELAMTYRLVNLNYIA